MASDIKKIEYELPIGTVLESSVETDGKKHKYTIEQVVNGKPLRKGQRIKPGDDVRPVLGQGGFGITYLASSTIMVGNIPVDMHFAIKEFFVKGSCYREGGSNLMRYSPAAEKDVKESLRDFKEEATRLKEICKGNPNIVNVNEVFEENGTAYYVMEFLEGESLRSLVKRTGPLSEGVALSYIRPIAEAVRYIHTQHRLLHLDIKPDNIMLRKSPDGQQAEPVLIDFGVSVHFNKKGDLTTTHTSVGVSEGYSPQEQYGGVAKIVADRKRAHDDGFTNVPLIPCEVDVYALGATLYYVLVGTNPYGAFSMTPEIVKAKLPSGISEKTKQVILGAMQPVYNNRTQTAADFLKGFEDRYTLPKGFVLHSPHAHYLITDVQKESDYYIQYGASLFAGNDCPHSGNMTKTQRYVVLERFNRRMYNRMKDESVKAKEDSFLWQKEQEDFLEVCIKHTGLQETGESEVIDGILVSEIFKWNGTTYAVVKQGWKPISPIASVIKNIGNHLNKNKKVYGITVATVFLVGGLAYSIHNIIQSYHKEKEKQEQEHLQLSQKLSSAIEKRDSVILLSFANQDSTRAFMPLTDIYLHASDTSKALQYAEMAARHGEDKGKSFIARIDSIKAEYAKRAKKANVDDQLTPVSSPPKQEIIDVKKEEPKIKNKESEQAEAARKALQYVNGARTEENHRKAYQWALKADPATRAKVIEKLKEMDFPIP